MGFSLNTSPAAEEDEGEESSDREGNSIEIEIEESFWQTHLWPPPNSNHQQSISHPPPHNTAPAFHFPILPPPPPAADHRVLVEAEVKEEEKTALTMNGRSNNNNNKNKKRRRSEEVANDHVNGERERRKKMRSMFTTLHAFLPHLSNKVDKATIVDEAITLIKNLQTTLQSLQQKAEELRSHPLKPACATFEPFSSTAPQLRLAGPTSRESFLADYAGLGHLSSKPDEPSYDEPQQGQRIMFQTWTSSNVVLNTFGKGEAVIMACSRKKRGVLSAIVAVLVKHKVEVEGLHVFCVGDHCSYMIHARLGKGAFDGEKVYKEAVSEMMLLVIDNPVKTEA